MTVGKEARALHFEGKAPRTVKAAPQRKVYSIAWDRLGNKLATGDVESHTAIWNLDQTGKPRLDFTVRGHKDSVEKVSWSPVNESSLATASADHTVKLWDVRSKDTVGDASTSGPNLFLAWKPDGSTLAVGNKKDVISFIDVRTFKVLSTFKVGQEAYLLNELAWNKAGNMLFYTTANGTVEVISYPELEPVRCLHSHTSCIYCIAFDPTGKHFASGGADAIISLWDVETLACVDAISQLDSPVRYLGFNRDGRYLAFASDDKSITFVDRAKQQGQRHGSIVHCIQVKGTVEQLAWNPVRDMIAWAGDHADVDHSRGGGSRGTEVISVLNLSN